MYIIIYNVTWNINDSSKYDKHKMTNFDYSHFQRNSCMDTTYSVKLYQDLTNSCLVR